MTYPPQQGGPYGQQPHSGGFPAQQPGYGRPPGAYGPPPGYGSQLGHGPPPGPPHRKNTGMIVGVIAALLLLVAGAVGFTGFVAPGYFLSDDTGGDGRGGSDVTTAPGSDAPTGSATAAPPGGTGGLPPSGSEMDQIKAVAEQAITSLNKRDESLANRITCDQETDADFSNLPPDLKAEITGEPTMKGPDSATVPFQVTIDGQTSPDKFDVAKQAGRWCVGA